MYRLQFYKQAARYYNKLDAKIQRRINTAIDKIVKNPSSSPFVVESTYGGDFSPVIASPDPLLPPVARCLDSHLRFSYNTHIYTHIQNAGYEKN